MYKQLILYFLKLQSSQAHSRKNKSLSAGFLRIHKFVTSRIILIYLYPQKKRSELKIQSVFL